jgi:hypothetical protein
MSKRVLAAIESCQQHRLDDVHDAIRKTWFRTLYMTDERFFFGIGRGMTLHADPPDTTCLECPDDYDSLSLKTQAICRWALEHDFDYMFKCDTDTVVNPWKFVFSGFEHFDYMGGENADVNVPGFEPGRIEFCSGGAGYWLSRKALTIVAEAASVPTCAEDVFVATVLKAKGILPVWHPGYRWRPGATVDKDIVSLHLSSARQEKYEPSMMYAAYAQIRELQC